MHTHFDHVLDSALVADRTGARLVGGESAANVGRGYGLAEDRLVVAEPGDANPVGRLRNNAGEIAAQPARPVPG